MEDMLDSYRHQGLRKALVHEIKQKGIVDSGVLKAIEKVPRHVFFDNAFLDFAYQDKAFPIGAGQTISQPYTVAFQSQLLHVVKGEKILEVGTGSGYQTCVLLELGAKVYTIERQKQLYTRSKGFLPRLGYSPKFFYGDGYQGLPQFAPFDKVLVTAGAPYAPEALLQQLRPGGLMVVPIGEGDIQVMTVFLKISDNQYDKSEFGEFRFVPLLSEKSR